MLSVKGGTQMKWCHLWNMLVVPLSMEIRSFEETLNRWHNFPVIVVTYYSPFKNSNVVSDSKLSPTFNLCQACDLRTSRWGWGDSLFFDLSSAAMWVWGSASSLPLGHPILFIFVSNLPGTGTGTRNDWRRKKSSCFTVSHLIMMREATRVPLFGLFYPVGYWGPLLTC